MATTRDHPVMEKRRLKAADFFEKKSPPVLELQMALLRHLPGKPLVIWDGSPIHRSAWVRDFVAAQGGRLVVERLPSYAPELNPVEYLWGQLKEHELGNLLVCQALQLSYYAKQVPCGECAAVLAS